MIHIYNVTVKHGDIVLHETKMIGPIESDKMTWLDGFIVGAATVLELDASELSVEWRPAKDTSQDEIYTLGEPMRVPGGCGGYEAIGANPYKRGKAKEEG